MDKESREHGNQWYACEVMYHDGSKSDGVHNQASIGRYGLSWQSEPWRETSDLVVQ